MKTSIIVLRFGVIALALGAMALRAEEPPTPVKVLRILPLGDSLTRGSYLRRYPNGDPVGLPSRDGGGYRKPLQDKLRADGIKFTFVGELSYNAYGSDGVVDPTFDPCHQGMAGFSNRKIISGGVVPTPQDVLTALGKSQIVAHGVVEVLEKFQPNLILLISGGNGFDAAARDELITIIGTHSSAQLIVGTITPQKPPRIGYEQVDDYNRSLPAFVKARQAAGQHISLVDLHKVVAESDLLEDGVHPNRIGLEKIASALFAEIKAEMPQIPVRTDVNATKP